MRVALVFCHPIPDSYGAHLRDRVLEVLSRDHETWLVDLYDGNELPSGFDRITHRAMLARSEAVVLVYPTWWSSFPAPLMSWIEEALEEGCLDGVRRVVAVTTHGSSRLVNAISGGIGRRIVRRGLRGMLAEGGRTAFLALYSMDRIGDRRRRRFANGLRRRLPRALG